MFLGGCHKANQQQKPLNPKNKQDNLLEISNSEQRIMASKISNLSEEVEGVNRAAVIITRSKIIDKNFIKKAQKEKQKGDKQNIALPDGGLIVIIGAGVNEKMHEDSDEWGKVHDELINKVKSADISISQVYATIDPEIVGKIDNIAAATLQGESVSKHEDEIKDIISEIKK